ncbi:hypothetical protein EDC01DRAFT_20516 [Geopyxis carbonaria]|nr:hypothetical protein EDC01DRAFT_20516 [Geopyxis carbonaria]
MGKLWGNNSSAQNNGESTNSQQAYQHPDERTSLLHESQQQQHHHLTPDDPAVSPYNQFSVRSLRWISIIFLFLSVLWWLLLLVATFVSPPGLHTRGGGWFGFAYTTLAVGNLLATIVFYSTPSKAERGIWIAILFFLFVDTILIIAPQPIRDAENWVGIVSVIWALIVTAWAIVCDRVVEHGKHREEERLTGRRETRRSLREWCSVFSGTILLVVFLAITILFTVNLSIRTRDATLPPPGNLYYVDGHKYQVHVYCAGNKTDIHGQKATTVFLEGGEDPVQGRIDTWVFDALQNRSIDRYCYWDRPGYAWSDNAPSPLSAGMAVDALSEALTQAGEDGPWVLVSHGVGGIYSRIFASRHAADIKGLLLIDNLPESLINHISSPKRGFFLWLRGVMYPLGIDRIITTIFMGHHREDRVYGRDAYQNGGQIKAKLQENLVAMTFTHNEIMAAQAILPKDVPVAVVSSGKAIKKSQEWNDGQRQLTKITDKLVAWDVINHASHNIWQDSKGKQVLEKRLVQLLRY